MRFWSGWSDEHAVGQIGCYAKTIHGTFPFRITQLTRENWPVGGSICLPISPAQKTRRVSCRVSVPPPGAVRTRKQKALSRNVTVSSRRCRLTSSVCFGTTLVYYNPFHSNEGNPNMENQPGSDGPTPQFAGTLVNSFVLLTSSSPEEALFFLESHNFDLDAAVSTFFDNAATVAHPNPNPSPNPNLEPHPNPPFPNSPPSQSPSPSQSQFYSPSSSRSRSPSPVRPADRATYQLRTRWSSEKKGSSSRSGGVRTLADLNEDADVDGSKSDESDEEQDYYTGGEKSGMLVRDPRRENDVDSIFDRARQAGAVERPAAEHSSRSKSFMGRGRLLLGEAVESAPHPPQSVNHTIMFCQNGFTVDDGPLRRLDDPTNAPFLESIKNSECPEELVPADRMTAANVDLVRREEVYSEPKRRQLAFRGTGRTLGSNDASSSVATSVPAVISASPGSSTNTTPFMGLVVDDSLPTTSIQLRLADGTRIVSRFNYSQTIRDIRAFIDASRPGSSRDYLLQTMGFPPNPLADVDQTIKQAGIANSVVIQKL